jgi:hypothetical protein
MATEGLFALLCAAALVAAEPTDNPSPPKEERTSAINDTLAVQTALHQAREFVSRHEFRQAIYVLESQLSRINGNRTYLSTLQDAYRGHIKELRLAKRDADAQTYLDRLRILDPGAVLDKNLSPGVTAATTPAKPAPVARGKIDEDPFRPTQKDITRSPDARGLLAQAEKEFAGRRYREARLLFEKAHQADRSVTEGSGERWAYCRLYYAVEQLNQPNLDTARCRELEREVQLAIQQAPRLEYAHQILGEIRKRTAPPEAGPPLFQHRPRGADGWAMTETINFRVFHNQSREYAEQVGRVAERTRAEMGRRWFGAPGPDWEPKCDLYLHATGDDYNRATGVSGTSPGHSSIKAENGRVVGRRIDLHCDDPNLLPAVLPHEATHVVLAGQFGERMVPRWADEGVAVLSEPREKVERHLRNLARCRQEGQVFPLHQLMQLNDYPDPRWISAFYAQSVGLVEFLANEKGPQVFTAFLRDGLQKGYEPALQQHYGWKGFAELEQRWAGYLARGGVTPTAVAGRGP